MDFEFIERVVRLVEEAEIAELELESGDDLRLVVKKSGSYIAAPAMYTQTIPSGYPPPSYPVAAPPAAAKEEAVDASIHVIRAPMVGTFYRAPAPDAPSFVETGAAVQDNTVVCILEAMKVMNEIKAGISGKVLEILVENGQPVEYGQPLFKIKKN
ncbi:MAG: acetyl-CoA carboxylase biotin carboxyl carrier protein [Candidatus Omnitrophota bacterium]|jgi:acetyl-CoA carboxylase biotin carboxyl carrier protein|nr:MAG: acetyl-CoA carboxylase biotin carboxyl carrier protein [Candidatus Omnitrophota bacterium]